MVEKSCHQKPRSNLVGVLNCPLLGIWAYPHAISTFLGHPTHNTDDLNLHHLPPAMVIRKDHLGMRNQPHNNHHLYEDVCKSQGSCTKSFPGYYLISPISFLTTSKLQLLQHCVGLDPLCVV